MEHVIYIFPINSNPLGFSYIDWSMRWWQWIASIPVDTNPAFDDTGQFINVNQKNKFVTFLCQTFEGVKIIPTRRNTIYTNRLFFLPIINWISVEGIDGKDEEEMKAIAKHKMDEINKLELKINGMDKSAGLDKFRISTDFFYLDLPRNNIFDTREGLRKCISDGYWVFFNIISDSLNISTNSLCSAGINQIAVDYNLKLL